MVEGSESRKSFASLPYIKGVTEPLTRVLKKQDITVVNKPLITLQQQFPAPKNFDHRWNRKQMLFIKFLVVTVHGVILVRLEGPSTQERKNTSEM